jgi:hypothetical protein
MNNSAPRINRALNAVKGLCSPAATLQITPYREILDLGAAPELMRMVFGAVHSVNRNSTTTYAAICLPGASRHRGLMQIGSRFVVVGSEEILNAVQNTDGFQTLKRRGLFHSSLRETQFEIGDTGSYLARTRKGDAGRGKSARQARRDARRAAHIARTRGAAPDPKPSAIELPDTLGSGFVRLGQDKVIGFTAGKAAWTGEDVVVNTYGLSVPSKLSVMPVAPQDSL